MRALNKKSVRITIGLVFLLLLIVSVVPSLYLYSSGDGIVSARTTTLTSPIEGVLHFPGSMAYGRQFNKGEVIGQVLNDRIDRSFLYELKTEKNMLESRIESFSERIKQYTKLSASLNDNLSKYQKFSAKQLEMLIRQDEHKLTEEKAEYERAKKEFEANKILAARDAINRRLLEQTESNYLRSSQRVMLIESKLEELRNSLEAVKSGAFLGDGHNDSPYSKQRMDQMVIELALARTAKSESKHRVEGINKQIVVEQERIIKAECFDIVSPFDSLVWRQPLTKSSTVVIGSELVVLLDCSSVFLDIAVSESQFSNIAPGEKIQYRLIGDTGFKTAEVIGLRGSGSELGDQNLAATLRKDPRKEFHVWARINPEELNLSPENFYQVGRRVEVKIPRKWRFFKTLSRFIDVF